MTNMIERVAKAICRADLKEGGDFNAAWEQESAVWLAEARVAIDAMRVPTNEMIKAAALGTSSSEETVIDMWADMIVAAGANP